MDGCVSCLRIAPQAVVIAALLVHQLDRLWDRGVAEARCTYAPVLGVRLRPQLTAAGQLAALPVALVLSLVTGDRIGPALLVAWWLLSIQRRLANHVWLGIVAVVAFAVIPARLDALLARDLLAGVYISAALFKLNQEYLFTTRSAGRLVTEFYTGLLGVRLPRPAIRAVPVSVIVVELATGLLLLRPGTALPGLLLAIAMHAVFGVSGNFTFSVVALGLWCVALTEPAAGVPAAHPILIVGALLGGAAAGAGLGRSALGARPVKVIARDGFKGACFGVLCVPALFAAGGPKYWHPHGGTSVDVACVVAFAVNFALVLAGLKLEWSFAMFTSLRPFGRTWLDRGWFSATPRYFLLTLPPRVPTAMLTSVPGPFLYEVTRPGAAVHETVAYCLEDLARQHSATFAPRGVGPDRTGQKLVPSGSARPPRLIPLLFPAVIPCSLERHYLG